MKKTALLAALFAGTVLCAAQNAPAAPVQAKPAVQSAAPVQAKPAVQSAAPVQAKPAAQPAPQKKSEPGIMFCLSRGLCNLTTGWLEIPRCMVYDNGFMPVFGLIVGIPEGACLTVTRMLSGIYDIFSFGTSGSSCHGDIFPNTVFQAKWSYKK